MDRHFLKRKGFSLFEVALALAVIGLLVTLSLMAWNRAGQRAKVTRTLRDLDGISTAAQWYYSKYGTWPSQISDMSPNFISSSVSASPFGNNYDIASTAGQITVSTLIPAGAISRSNVGPQVVITNEGVSDKVSVSRPLPGGKTGRLKYDKKYLYEE